MSDDPSVDLLARFRAGDPKAADELFERYTARLIALARRSLSSGLARRVEPEDVVQSVYRSFCVAAREDHYVLQRSGDLWKLLATITLNKVRRGVERHTALRRSVDRERGFGGESSLAVMGAQCTAPEPTPSEALELVELVEGLLRPLKPIDRRIVELRMQGYRIEEIAYEVDRSERWVRRVLEQAKVWLARSGQVSSDA
jgi:DNA-directed RNA polymerase specialized sigma24 family protein